jgi:hypothetical protein
MTKTHYLAKFGKKKYLVKDEEGRLRLRSYRNATMFHGKDSLDKAIHDYNAQRILRKKLSEIRCFEAVEIRVPDSIKI